MTTLTPYRPELHTGRDGFAQLFRAEWTKFRTVRGWVIGMTAALLVIVGIGALTGANSECGIQMTPTSPSLACPAPPTGPGGGWVTDSFYFVRQPLAGNGSITVRVTSLTGLYSTHGLTAGGAGSPTAGMTPGVQPWSKAGIIIKASTRSGSAYAASASVMARVWKAIVLARARSTAPAAIAARVHGSRVVSSTAASMRAPASPRVVTSSIASSSPGNSPDRQPTGTPAALAASNCA